MISVVSVFFLLASIWQSITYAGRSGNKNIRPTQTQFTARGVVGAGAGGVVEIVAGGLEAVM